MAKLKNPLLGTLKPKGFKPVSSQVNFPAFERKLLEYWEKQRIVEKYLHRNDKSDKKFSFLDGPITANNPMGVHHAWGRTYKDLWQRFFNMKGYKQRFQNGFDEQGLWVEVEVEKELGLKSKKDIENLIPGDKFKSLEKFINLCKERVKKYSAIQTEQSKRLGYFMDWDNSYHTSSDRNNYAIWNYLKVVNEKGWLYKGRDSVPWCPRCGTAISQHEILAEEYKEIEHESVYFKLPIKGRKNEYLVVWTTTPWTIPANVAVAVNPDLEYVKLRYWVMSEKKSGSPTDTEDTIYIVSKTLADGSIRRENKVFIDLQDGDILETFKGKELVNLEYDAPFDHLPRISESLGEYKHRVVSTDDLILPITAEEGTGLVHVAPGAGAEDFKLGQKLNLPVIELINEEANYLDKMEGFSGQNAKKLPKLIIDFLKEKDNGRFLLKTDRIKHRYPSCWRCKTELVWRVVDEWYISMDKKDNSGKTYREQMVDVAKKINWIPKWGLDRELDWLKNMHDWLISKKRYWGLSLPVWECEKCGNFEVIGGKEELKERAVEGWEKFEGNSPHRPWIDQIKIKCSKCEEIISRIPDVGNPWLDAGIVPFSTMPEGWFPADFITEGFPGQFKNWFYSLIAMSTALRNENPFKNLLGFANVVDEKGEEMHKSKGNAVEFNEAADKIGVDVMRWLYLRTNPEHNVNFGFHVLDEIKRLFLLKLWNVYSFFVMYANLNDWEPKENFELKHPLDRWILSRMSGSMKNITKSLDEYDSSNAMGLIEIFIFDLSNWYVRRIRDRVGTDNKDRDDRNGALETLNFILREYSKVMVPFVPFITEEIYRNLTNGASVHLSDWPDAKGLYDKYHDDPLEIDMTRVMDISELVHAKRKEAGIKLRQPLASLKYRWSNKLDIELEKILQDEVNVKEIKFEKSSLKEPKVELDTKITQQLQEEGKAREFIRMVQQSRKDQDLTLQDKTKIIATSWPVAFEKKILEATASVSIEKGSEFKILRINETSKKH